MQRAKNGPTGLLVTGAQGRVGRALRAVWGAKLSETLPILWCGRAAGPLVDVVWDIGQNPPDLPRGLIVLHLAGRVSGAVEENVAVTEAVCRAALAAGAHHVFVMSTAAVYAPGPLPLDEHAVPAPVSAYGRAKLEAEHVARRCLGPGVTMLRLANLAGADALLGTVRATVMLDPVAGQSGGPVRSYIGPRALAQVLAGLMQGGEWPDVVNIAQQPPVSMAALLDARGQDWAFGPPRDGVVPRVVLDTSRLAALTDLPQTSPAALIADMDSVRL